MTIVSNIPKPEGGFYQVGDKLATREECVAFLRATGWLSFKYFTSSNLLVDCENDSAKCSVTPFCDSLLPYTIVGFLPEHTAKPNPPNPPLTFEEAIELEAVWLVAHPRICLEGNFLERDYGVNSEQWGEEDFTLISACIAHGNVYALDPTVYPPTPREEG